MLSERGIMCAYVNRCGYCECFLKRESKSQRNGILHLILGALKSMFIFIFFGSKCYHLCPVSGKVLSLVYAILLVCVSVLTVSSFLGMLLEIMVTES